MNDRCEPARRDPRPCAFALAAAGLLACATPATPPRPGDFPIEGRPGDARPDPVIPRAPLEREDLRDLAIENAIRRGLAGEWAALAATIDVAVADGAVTLAGTLPAARLRREAAEIAGAVAGVTAVDNRIQLDPVARTDAAIAQDVQAAMANLVAAPRRPAVSVAGGVVTLSGELPSHALRRRIEDRVGEVPGVTNLVSRLAVTVRGPAPPDARLEAEIEAQLRELSPDVAGAIDVTVERRVATLAGEIPTFALRRAVLERASLPDVLDVRADGLRVRWKRPAPEGRTVAASPAELRAEVQAELAADPMLVDLPIAVGVEGRTAILSGEVPTLEARRTANAAAAASPGIEAVEDRLAITRAAASDEALAARVVGALARDPYLDSRTIVVRVQDGRVHLVGTVDAGFERARATRVVSRVAGIREVINALALGSRPAAT